MKNKSAKKTKNNTPILVVDGCHRGWIGYVRHTSEPTTEDIELMGRGFVRVMYARMIACVSAACEIIIR